MGQLRDSAAAVENELAELEKTMDQTQAAIDSKKPSLAAVAAYTDLRKGRPASERLCDAVKSDLERMRATLLETVRLLESALAAQQSEKVRLEAHMRLLQADMEDKTAGRDIDSEAKSFTNTSRPRTAPAQRGAASMTLPHGMYLTHAPYDPVTWRNDTNALCRDAEKSRQTVARLGATTAKLMRDRELIERSVYDNLVAHREHLLMAIREVIAKVEAQITACEAEQGELVKQHGACQQSYQDKQDAFGVVVDRLSYRSARPPRELVTDLAQRALNDEVATLKAASRQLEGTAMMLTNSHGRLMKELEQLKETVALKAHFLEIEEAGAPHMAVLAEHCGNVAPAPFAPFGAPVVRPISALPSNRLSVSRVYASR